MRSASLRAVHRLYRLRVSVGAEPQDLPRVARPRRGQSLVVWAIREGRQAARAVDEYLMGSSTLPR
jgi:hypothetical protein